MTGLAVSNLAWPAEALDDGLALLRALGCDAVEIAPFAVFGRWDGLEDAARRFRERLERQGLACVAMQGVLFGADDVALFGTAGQRDRFARHLDGVAALAGWLGAGACVFGAPRQRDPGTLGEAAAWDQAVATLRRAGPAFAAAGAALAIEAVPAAYGCRFVTSTMQAVRLAEAVDAPGVAVQIDTGTALVGGEDPGVIAAAAARAAHLHVSEPGLGPVGAGAADHAPLAAAVRASGYDGAVSIEMRAVPDWAAAVTRAVGFVRAAYL